VNIQQAINLRESGKVDEALLIIMELIRQHPHRGDLNYQAAWCNDLLGNEHEAIPFYLRAIESGLVDDDLKGAYLGLGSTYRAIGKYEEARRTFEIAIDLFPKNNEFYVFKAMTLYNLEEYGDAFKILLRTIADFPGDENLEKYKRAIYFYSDKLEETW